MCNLYVTSESEQKIKTIFCNLKNFFILDVDAFVKSLNLDLTKQANVYLANSEIEKVLYTQSKMKKHQGIIYITGNLCEKLVNSMKNKFRSCPDIGKIVLIENGQFPTHNELMTCFDEVLFYDRFKKNKIIECNGFVKDNHTDRLSAVMDELLENK